MAALPPATQARLPFASMGFPTPLMDGDISFPPWPMQALELLNCLPRMENSNLLFPNTKGGPLSDMALSMMMRRPCK